MSYRTCWCGAIRLDADHPHPSYNCSTCARIRQVTIEHPGVE